MRKFIDFLGEEQDLDDPITYDYLPDNWRELDDLMFKNIGYYYCYVNYFHKGWCKSQEERCDMLIKEFCDGRKENLNNVKWMQERVHIFTDETENMC